MLNLRFGVLALLLLCVSASASWARQEAGQVSVPLSAVDREGRPVEGLKAEDLRVTVEGAEQKVVSLTPRAEEPVRVVLMLDTSASQEQVLRFARPAAVDLIRELLRPGSDEAAVVSFTGEVKVVQRLTNDKGALARAVESVEFDAPAGYIGGGVLVANVPPSAGDTPAGSTAVWDSLVEVCDKLFARAGAGRRVVVLFSDGVDTSSRTKRDKAVERLVRDGVSVFSVGVGDTKNFDGVMEEDLRRLSKRTGGRAYFPKKVNDLVRALEEIRLALRSAYALSLAAPAPRHDRKPSALRVEVVSPELRKRGVELAHPQNLFIDSSGGRP